MLQLTKCKECCEQALEAKKMPQEIVMECLGIREQRSNIDLVADVKKTYPEENWKSFLPKLYDCHQLCPLLHPPTPRSKEESISRLPNYSVLIGAMSFGSHTIPAMSWADSLSPARPSTCQLLSHLPRGTRDSL